VARSELGRRKLGKQLEAAAREGAHFAVIVGDELSSGEVQMRDLPAGTQKVVPIAELAREIARSQAAHRHRRDER
jgi:histidyl-tRNA synthetase